MDCLQSHSSTSLTLDSEGREQSCGYSTTHVTSSHPSSEDWDVTTSTHIESDAVGGVVKDMSVPEEAQVSKGMCCHGDEKGAARQTLESDSVQHDIELGGVKEEENPTQQCEVMVSLKEKSNIKGKREGSETARDPTLEVHKRTKKTHEYSNYRRRNCGYYGYSSTTSQQSSFSPRHSKQHSSSHSSFNHKEVAEFLWKSRCSNICENT